MEARSWMNNNPKIPPSESALKESGKERNEEEKEGHITHQPIKIDTTFLYASKRRHFAMKSIKEEKMVTLHVSELHTIRCSRCQVVIANNLPFFLFLFPFPFNE